ncbi:hypothetical protein [Roseomonas elaeocarpi]|uniref:Uncharacterized protein n=1 Tax=Roseomonas elaeocarpi TaxID=907779 RepID=A0ABV6JSX5_9PROT
MSRSGLLRWPHMPRAGLAAGAVLSGLALAGCSDNSGALPDKAALLAEVMNSYRASLQAVGSPDAPPGEAAPSDAARQAAAPLRPVASRVPAGLSSLPGGVAALNGQAANTVSQLLGQPVLRRAEGSAQIWLYTARDCQIDIVFYPGTTPNDLRVGWAAARAAGTGRVTEDNCLREVAAAGAGRPGT